VQVYVSEGTQCHVWPAASSNGARLFRSYNPSAGDHFYTTSEPEHLNAVANLGYTDEGVGCRVEASAGAGTTPLYRAYHPATNDHFYTTSQPEHRNAVDNLGYADEGVACHVFPAAGAGTVPLLRMWNSEVSDHFYSTSQAEHDAALGNPGPAIAINTLITTMQQIYNQANIKVDLLSTQFISHPEAVDCDVGSCTAGSTTGEQDRLFALRDGVELNDIVVYLVRTTNPALNGCAAFPSDRPSAVVVRNATRFTFAHEVGHILGLNHVNDNTRLMTGNGTANITVAVPVLTSGEALTMDASVFTRDI
jgi:hypothetical protein